MEEASWQKAITNYFSTSTPALLAMMLGLPEEQPSPDNRIALDVNNSLGAQAGLDTAGDWPAALSKTLARQSILGNVVSETFKAITRIAGWGLMTLVLYPNVFTSRKKRAASWDDADMEKVQELVDRVASGLEDRVERELVDRVARVLEGWRR